MFYGLPNGGKVEVESTILVIGPNAALDRTVTLPHLSPGEVHRAQEEVVMGGGKGGNVARILRQLGVPVTLAGFRGGWTGRMVQEDLASLGIEGIWVDTSMATRICDILVDLSTGQSTVINGLGPSVVPVEWEALDARVQKAMDPDQVRLVVATGSVPPGCPASAYRQWAVTARERGIPFLVDASGELLRETMEGLPTLVKVNVQELLDAFGKPVPAPARARWEAVRQVAFELLAQGVGAVVVTDGARGAYAWEGDRSYYVPALSVPVVSPIACGDAFLAGMVAARLQGEDLVGQLRLGQAAAAGNLAHLGCGFPPHWDARAQARQVSVLPGAPPLDGEGGA